MMSSYIDETSERNLHLAELVCDCHIHSFTKNAGSLAATYVPPQKDISDYIDEIAPTGIKRAVVVQASVDGVDNSRLVGVLKNQSPIALRGVGMIDPARSDLPSLHTAGVRAIRVQDRVRLGQSDLDRLPEFARCAAALGWHLELNTEPRSFSDIAIQIPTLPAGLLLVLDHLGQIDPKSPSEREELFRLLDTGRAWVKLSPTRVSRKAGDYSDLAGVVAEIGAAYPEQCIWGSDWPHVMTPPPVPDIPPMLALLKTALNAKQFHACMWSNPEKLYGF